MTVQGITGQSEGLQSLKTLHSLQLGLSLVVDLGERNNKKTLLTVAFTYQSLLINTTSNTLMSFVLYNSYLSTSKNSQTLIQSHPTTLIASHTFMSFIRCICGTVKLQTSSMQFKIMEVSNCTLCRLLVLVLTEGKPFRPSSMLVIHHSASIK